MYTIHTSHSYTTLIHIHTLHTPYTSYTLFIQDQGPFPGRPRREHRGVLLHFRYISGMWLVMVHTVVY